MDGMPTQGRSYQGFAIEQDSIHIHPLLSIRHLRTSFANLVLLQLANLATDWLEQFGTNELFLVISQLGLRLEIRQTSLANMLQQAMPTINVFSVTPLAMYATWFR